MTAGRSVLIWNGMAVGVPALVVKATSIRDVAEAVAFARDHGLSLRIRGAGDAVEDSRGAAPGERCVTLDLSRTRGSGDNAAASSPYQSSTERSFDEDPS